MRKYSIQVLILVVLAPCFLPAQVIDRAGVTLGGGISRLRWEANYSDINLFDEFKPVFAGSAGVTYGVHRNWALSSNLMFVQKGGKDEIALSGSGETRDVAASINYLGLNTLFILNIHIRSELVPYLSFGPSVLTLLFYSDDVEEYLDTDELEEWIFGGIINAGVSKQWDDWYMGVELSNLFSKTKVASWTHPTPKGKDDISLIDRTLFFNVKLEYRFPD